MRCVDVARELAVPTGAGDSAAMDRHLASCAACASRAEELRQFEFAWDGTRPVEPSAETIDQIWDQVSRRLDSESAPSIIPFNASRPHTGRWWAVASLAAVGQAAAVFVAGMLFAQWQSQSAPERSPAEIPVVAVPVFDLDAGQTLLLEVDESGDHVLWRPQIHPTSELAQIEDTDNPELISVAMWDMNLLGAMESIDPSALQDTSASGDGHTATGSGGL